MCIAILSAMAEENASLVSQMTNAEEVKVGRRVYHRGELWGIDVVVVFSHWGKVAAASTTTMLIDHFDASEILFTGVAGAVSSSLNVGDIVVASDLYQHDMDARPIIERHEIPLLGIRAIPSCLTRRRQLVQASTTFVNQQLEECLPAGAVEEFSLNTPKVMTGAVASGDQFISSQKDVEDLRQRLPDVLCVEMEGAAVAQVCIEFGIPFSVVRTISDAANEAAGVDFPKFINEVAQVYSLGIVKNLLQSHM